MSKSSDATPPPAGPKAKAAAKSRKGPAASVSGPSNPAPAAAALNPSQTRMLSQADGAQALAAAVPFNPIKDTEFGRMPAQAAGEGGPALRPMTDDLATASTVQETVASDKLGDGGVRPGQDPLSGPLDRVRVDATDRALTTNQGVAVADNQNSLKAGLRGPTLLEDFILREKITHFDHERIPERVVHARGSAAHGFFECYEALTDLTRAAPFAHAGKRTPVFVRFSTVAGERGSADAVRDVRGFAVKFYTDEGNWDLVGNNIPVFFIQDAMKFPDLVHALKPEPHHAMPQAASAHDTFWDFVSLMPESTHMLMWVMSDRAIPRSYRTMQGFGVNTYRLVNAEGASVFVKFHWLPKAGTHSLVWDEAVRINGADPDFHRRDLWESIESGCCPEYELALQVITEELAEQFSFDILDPTKLVPEEMVPLQVVGRMVLNRNPDNFFAETEQVAFCTAHVVPGIDFSNDPLLQGRIHSYVDTQLSRLGGPNFHEIPINAPVSPVHNNQRDGMHRQAIHRGRVAYEPNSLGGGCPFQAGRMGFVSVNEPMQEDKVRGKPEKFADHYSQASLFWRSQTEVEQRHIVGAFRFELSKVTVPAVRQRVLAQLRNVDESLAQQVADGLGLPLPEPLPPVLGRQVQSEVEASPGLSLFARPGEDGARGRRVAMLVADGAGTDLDGLRQRLLAAGVVPRYVGSRLGPVALAEGKRLEAEATLENAPSVLWDAVVVLADQAGRAQMERDAHWQDFVREASRHCKTLLLVGEGEAVLARLDIPLTLPDGQDDPGLLLAGHGDDAVADRFLEALARHRHFERETDPPKV
ncbi:catalase [Hydrogenophaga pseudoflava]|uniref:catalase n=1 Tax=Hydrogenophaga pseudoflava TaxID=47421 RepID=UPI0027E56823|nr:catalase [Hydrogenophaga pseudoflava]MDQ7744371.1 catalase [Hydrogenophaga pseudoflava]